MYAHLPLSRRVIRSNLKPQTLTSLERFPRGSYRHWDDVRMQNAMMAVEKGEPVRRAAEMFNVPKSTLHDHITGKVMFGARSGPDPYLTVEEEEELASFLIQTAKIGYPHTKKQIISLVQQIIDSKGIDTTVTNGWWERFSQRHPSMTLRVAVPFSIARAMATDVDVLNK